MKSHPSSASREPRRGKRRHPKFSAEGLERLRAAALANRPWEKTRGPISPEGKARASRNGRFNQKGEKSQRQLHVELAGVFNLINRMVGTRRSLQ
jgi:hypothetical protein